MLTFNTIQSVKEFLSGKKREGKTTGFVPTMGALHEGHLELMRRAKKKTTCLRLAFLSTPFSLTTPKTLKNIRETWKKINNCLKVLAAMCFLHRELQRCIPRKRLRKF